MSLSESLETEIDLLRRRITELESALVQRASNRDSLRLTERIKELSALYRESYLADQQRSSTEDYLIELVALLPLAWQYTTDACARILVNGCTYATPNFQESAWQQSSTIIVENREIGRITVGYLSPHDEMDEGPFLSEERSLLNEITKRVGRFIERRQMETSHRFLAAIVESSDYAIVSVTLDGTIQTWNAAAERIYGYTRREIIGKTASMIMTPQQYDEMLRILRRTRAGYITEQFDTVRCHKDGSEVHVSVSLYPISDAQGRVVGAAVLARDISDRRLIEATLRESDERLRSTFEQAAVGLAHLSLDGRHLRVNQRLCSILGYEQAELLSLTMHQFTHPDDLPAEQELLRSVLTGERDTYSLEKRSLCKDGSIVWVNSTLSLARDHADQPKYLIAVVEDISLRKEAEQASKESETRYRDLFENSPISLWEQDFSGVKAALDRLSAAGVTNFRAYFEENTDAVRDCLAQVKLIAFNHASLALYGAVSKAELLSSLDRLIPASGYAYFIDELVWLAEGCTAFTWEGVNRRLTGEHIAIRLHWSAVPGYEETLRRVLVSIEEIGGASQQMMGDA